MLLNHDKYNYLHCKSAQNMPLFLETVSESELIVRKFPWAVHNTEWQRNGEKQMMHEYKAGKALQGWLVNQCSLIAIFSQIKFGFQKFQTEENNCINKNKMKPHQNLLAAPIPTRTDPRYKAQTIGFRKDKIKTLQTEVQGT